MLRLSLKTYHQLASTAIRQRLESGDSVGETLRGALQDCDVPLTLMKSAICEVLEVTPQEASRLMAREITMYRNDGAGDR